MCSDKKKTNPQSTWCVDDGFTLCCLSKWNKRPVFKYFSSTNWLQPLLLLWKQDQNILNDFIWCQSHLQPSSAVTLLLYNSQLTIQSRWRSFLKYQIINSYTSVDVKLQAGFTLFCVFINVNLWWHFAESECNLAHLSTIIK